MLNELEAAEIAAKRNLRHIFRDPFELSLLTISLLKYLGYLKI